MGERLTIGLAKRLCASQAPQVCLAAAKMNLRLAPPRRNTRTSVRFDGCPRSHGSSKKDCFVSSSWFLCCLCLLITSEKCHLVLNVTVVCMLDAFLFMFCLCCPAVLTTRLTDSVGHPFARKTLPVATLVSRLQGHSGQTHSSDLFKRPVCLLTLHDN